jgi:hypothetical protein
MDFSTRRSASPPFALVITCLLCFRSEAKAYIDPGAGSVLLQGFLGFMATAFAIIITYWRNVRRLLGKVARTNRRDG